MHIEDKLSVTFTVTAALMIIYLETFLGNPASLAIAITLLTTGIGLQVVIWGKIRRDTTMSEKELTTITTSSLIAMAGMMFASFTIPRVFVAASLGSPLEPVSQLAIYDQFIHGQVYAVAEEIFFRGAVLGFILWQVPYDLKFGKLLGFKLRIPKEWFASGLSATIFALYHLAVYGYTNATFYVFVAGFILGMVTAYTKRLSPAILAHCMNNAVSVLLVTGGLP